MGHLIFYCLHRHQAVRWLNTKEEHAGREKRLLAPCRITCLPEPQPSMNRIDCSPAGIIENMSEYMLAQRIKPPAEPTGPKQEQYVALLQVVADFLDGNEMRALLSCAHVYVVERWQAVHKVMRMAVLCKQNSEPVHATNLHAVIDRDGEGDGGSARRAREREEPVNSPEDLED